MFVRTEHQLLLNPRVSPSMSGVLVAFLVSLLCLPSHTQPVVQTDCGPVMGYTETIDGVLLSIFKGIPYAAPPTAARRWQPPMSPKEAGTCWAGTLNATSYGSVCVQWFPGSDLDGRGSEDCLFLNVFSPAGLQAAGLATLVYIHGGDSIAGSSQMFDFSLAAADGPVVVVTINYRLNAFGYLALRELSQHDPRGVSGNYGVLDAQLALRWVQTNIAAFGGDPKRVTLAGQSSGGTAVLALLSSPASSGLFSRAMSLSGSANFSMSLDDAQRGNADFVHNANCSLAEDVYECLMALSTSQVHAAMPAWYSSLMVTNGWIGGIPSQSPNWPGLVITDGVTVVRPLLDALAAAVVDVPLVIQSMAQEGAYEPEYDIRSYSASQYLQLLETAMANYSDAKLLAQKVFGEYYDFVAESPMKGMQSFAADFGVTCASLLAAQAAAAAFRNPVYYVHVTQGPQNPLTASDPNYNTTLACHLWDLMAATGNFQFWHSAWGVVAYDVGAEDLAFGELLRETWYEFMADGSLPAAFTPATPGYSLQPVNVINLQVVSALG
eukprot:TRINITY_DN9551_c0_g2_i1.p1 TRINITY_DN9551_c0_g2~~TRINITY_DN9551_c0_g2_i1.p1  ORF type:complete len:579 (+),score=120.00 TRINITY_DN9551_c0_g2_i1:87-1739(+)